MNESDTLKIILEAIESSNLNELDVVQKIDAFYNNAWNKLIFIITIGFTVVGVVLPLFIQWLQKKALKTSEELLKNEIKTASNKLGKDIKSNLMTAIDEKFKKYEKEIEITRASGKAKTFFSEGKYNLEKNLYDRALSDFINSAYACITCNDHKTLQELMKYILSDCLPYLSKEEIEDLKIAQNGDLLTFLEELNEKDDRGIYQTIIGEIRVKLTKLPKTIKDKPSEQSKKS